MLSAAASVDCGEGRLSSHLERWQFSGGFKVERRICQSTMAEPQSCRNLSADQQTKARDTASHRHCRGLFALDSVLYWGGVVDNRTVRPQRRPLDVRRRRCRLDGPSNH